VHDDPGQPCWQYPHGTSSHVGQPVAVAGAAVVGFDAAVGKAVGAALGSGAMTGGSVVAGGVGAPGRQTFGNSP